MTIGGKVFLAAGRRMVPVPRPLFRFMVGVQARAITASIAFMTAEHHRVRDFAVTELMRTGVPVAPEAFSETLGFDGAALERILEELERRLTFLVRNESGEVTWAYPITVEPTPHRARFAGGERAYSP